MKYTYENFYDQLSQGIEPVLYYLGNAYWISLYENLCFFIKDNNVDYQVFNNIDDLINNAKIDGKLLSTIWSEIDFSSGVDSEIKINFHFTGYNLNIEEITKEIGIQDPKIIKQEEQAIGWFYTVCAENNVLNIHHKIDEFLMKMVGKEDSINFLTEKHKDSILTLAIIGNPFSYATQFYLPPEFITFAKKINTNICFESNFNNRYDLVKIPKINGELISEIWPNIIIYPGIGSKIKIVLRFKGINLNMEYITKEMKLQNLKIIKRGEQAAEWIYIFNSKYLHFNIDKMMEDFLYKMKKRIDIIIMLKKEYKNMKVDLIILGDIFDNATCFSIPVNFINFAKKINAPISFDKNLIKYI